MDNKNNYRGPLIKNQALSVMSIQPANQYSNKSMLINENNIEPMAQSTFMISRVNTKTENQTWTQFLKKMTEIKKRQMSL